MARIPSINVVQNDNNIKLIFNIKKDGIYESLLGATVYLQMTDYETGEVLRRTATITDATTAECMYVLTKDDLTSVATLQTEIQVQYANGTRLTQRNPVIINVLPEIVLN